MKTLIVLALLVLIAGCTTTTAPTPINPEEPSVMVFEYFYYQSEPVNFSFPENKSEVNLWTP
jgi:hypothetical protein